MRKIFYLSIVFLFSLFAHCMESPHKLENKIVKFNMGSYKCHSSLNMIRTSGSDFLQALVDDKLNQNVNEKDRIFFDCPKSIAETMHYFMCFYELPPNQDYELALKTADFFQCGKLRDYIAIKKDLQPSYGWIQIDHNRGKLQTIKMLAFVLSVSRLLNIKYKAKI